MSQTDQVPWSKSLVLALLATLPFLLSLPGPFIYDDQNFLTETRIIHEPTPFSRAIWAGNFSDLNGDSGVQSVPYYRPVTLVSYWVDHALWGSNPLGFHISNVLFFLLLLLLLHRLLLRVMPPGAAGILLLLFGLHPAHCETVSWISGRTDLLATLFFMAAVWILRPRQNTRSPRMWRFFTGTLFLLLSLLSKESHLFLIAVLPFLLFIWHRSRQNAGNCFLWGLLWLAPLAWLLMRLGFLPGATPLILDGTSLQKALMALGYYTQKTLFPLPLSFTMDPGALRPWHALLAIPVLLLCPVEWLRLPGTLRQNKPATPWVTLYVLALGPALLLQLSPEVYFTLAWRFMFLPVLIPWGLAAHHINRLQPRLRILLVLALLLFFSAQSLPMNWRLGQNPSTFWSSLDPEREHPMARIRAVMVGYPNDPERAEAVLDDLIAQNKHPQYPRIMQETLIARATLLSQWGRCDEAKRLWRYLSRPQATPERVWMQYLYHCSLCRDIRQGERILDQLLPQPRLSLGFLDAAVLFTFSSGRTDRARDLLDRMERENGRSGQERAHHWRTRHPALCRPRKDAVHP